MAAVGDKRAEQPCAEVLQRLLSETGDPIALRVHAVAERCSPLPPAADGSDRVDVEPLIRGCAAEFGYDGDKLLQEMAAALTERGVPIEHVP